MTWKIASGDTTRGGQRRRKVVGLGGWCIKKSFRRGRVPLPGSAQSRIEKAAPTSNPSARRQGSVRTVRATRTDRSRVRVASRLGGIFARLRSAPPSKKDHATL
jgi:hypothetical protein